MQEVFCRRPGCLAQTSSGLGSPGVSLSVLARIGGANQSSAAGLGLVGSYGTRHRISALARY
jgi:hypothetical protein